MRGLAPPAFALALWGCAPQLTPQQEWVITNFEECKRETNAINANLDRVTPEGHMYISAAQTQTEINLVLDCMKKRQQQRRAP